MGGPPLVEDRYEPYDVLVVGGGMAGIAAAIAAARRGARTMLIEQQGSLGGLGITGATGLHTFYNIYGAEPGAQPLRAVAGIAQELVDRCRVAGGAIGHVPMERGADFVSRITPVEPEVFKHVAAQMCVSAGVKLLLHSVVDEVFTSDDRIDRVVVFNKAGRTVVRAAIYIDSTGDGDLAAWAGAPFEHYQPGETGAYTAGFTFRLCNIDLSAFEADLERRCLITQLAHAVKPGMRQPEVVRLGIHLGALRQAGDHRAPLYFLSTSIRPRELTYCNCLNFGPNDGLDPEALTAAELDVRGRMLQLVDLFKERFAGCGECYAAGTAPTVGQRRARAIHCLHDLSNEEVIAGQQFSDAVACFGFIDNGSHFVHNAGCYQIPYRALVPRDVDNLYIAGRMMTIDLIAHNSTRNTVCCLACGQAAGTAAALAVQTGRRPADVEVELLQAMLREDDALLEPVPEKAGPGRM
jgi:hypothetical protein